MSAEDDVKANCIDEGGPWMNDQSVATGDRTFWTGGSQRRHCEFCNVLTLFLPRLKLSVNTYSIACQVVWMRGSAISGLLATVLTLGSILSGCAGPTSRSDLWREHFGVRPDEP